jgi:hypothetical protein
MKQPDIYLVFDECLTRLRQGETVDDCLVDYPDQAGELAPLVTTAADLFQIPLLMPSAETAAQGMAKMIAAFDADVYEQPVGLLTLLRDRLSQKRLVITRFSRLVLPVAVLILMILIVSSSLAITASAESLPGQALYPLKRSLEETRLTFTFDETLRQNLQREFSERRRSEVKSLLLLRQPETVEFEGTVEQVNDDLLQVGGLPVGLTGETAVVGQLRVGQAVFVRGQVRADGQLVALRIVGDEQGPSPTVESTQAPQPTNTQTPSFTPTQTTTHSPTPKPAEPTETDQPTHEATATHEPTPTHRPPDDPPRDDSPIGGSPTLEPPPSDEPTPTHRPPDDPPSGDSRDDDLPADVSPTLEPLPTDADLPEQEPTRPPADDLPSDDSPTREPTVPHEPTRPPDRDALRGDGSGRPP